MSKETKFVPEDKRVQRNRETMEKYRSTMDALKRSLLDMDTQAKTLEAYRRGLTACRARLSASPYLNDKITIHQVLTMLDEHFPE